MRIPHWKWLLASLLSLGAHISVVYLLFFQSRFEPSPLPTAAVIVEFSNPPQSITMEHDLPIGPPQQMSQEATVAEPEPEKREIPELPTVEQESPPDVKPEIEVAKAQKQPDKRVIKPKKVQPEKPKKQQKNQEKRALAEQESPAGSMTSSAPPKGESNKIAAEFNSSGKSIQAEANWRGLVKAHLERRLRYPEQALKKRWKGKSTIRVRLDQSGNVLAVELTNPSGRTEFDREAVDNAKRSSPLPKPPAELLSGNQLIFTVPIQFDYETYRH